VGEVGSICAQTCGGGGSGRSGGAGGSGGTGGVAGAGGSGGTGGSRGSNGSCSHAICSSGSKPVSRCNARATTICAQDPYCCNTKWDNQCVSEVGSMCGQTCP